MSGEVWVVGQSTPNLVTGPHVLLPGEARLGSLQAPVPLSREGDGGLQRQRSERLRAVVVVVLPAGDVVPGGPIELWLAGVLDGGLVAL